jgi:hypothetical protein
LVNESSSYRDTCFQHSLLFPELPKKLFCDHFRQFNMAFLSLKGYFSSKQFLLSLRPEKNNNNYFLGVVVLAEILFPQKKHTSKNNPKQTPKLQKKPTFSSTRTYFRLTTYKN